MTQLLASKSKSPALASYAQLREKVRETLLEGQRKIEEAKVQTYWQTGKHIYEHILHYQHRANYGEEVMVRLSDDLEVDLSVLRKIRKFYRLFQKGATWPLLVWGHYRALLAVEDEAERFKLAETASKNGWPVRRLEIEVRNRNWSKRIVESDDEKSAQLPPVALGPFHTYKIIRPETIHQEERTLLLDMGFSMKKELNAFPGARYRAGTIVTSVRDSSGRNPTIPARSRVLDAPSFAGHYSLEKVTKSYEMLRQVTSGSKKQPHETLRNPTVTSRNIPWSDDLLYTYKAYVVNVIDGDTLKVEFRLGFGDRKGETIRLNHIDCPEIDTPEGRAAKRFVESQLASCEYITVKSVRTRKEKWGRYLGDVFFAPSLQGTKSATKIGGSVRGINGGQSQNLVYLNQLLLDKGYAVRVRM